MLKYRVPFLIIISLFNVSLTFAQVNQLSVENNMSCVVTNEDMVKCWGDNWINQNLGYEDKISRGGSPDTMGRYLDNIDLGIDFDAKQVVVGTFHTCALSKMGRVKCWGNRDKTYALGIGNNSTIGWDKNTMGDNLPYVDLGGKSVALSIGSYFTCSIMENGGVKCWGENDIGELGQGHNEVVGRSLSEMGKNLPYVDLDTVSPVKEIYSTYATTCVVFYDHRAKCWGAGETDFYPSDLGTGWEFAGATLATSGKNLPFLDFSGLGTPAKVVPGSDRTCAIFTNGKVTCYGEDFLGYGDELPRRLHLNQAKYIELGEGVKVVDISLADEGACVLTDDGRVKCWGGYSSDTTGCYPFLGQERCGSVGARPDEMGDNLPWTVVDKNLKVESLSCQHASHCCALLENGKVKCWGENSLGQLGLENSIKIGHLPNSMGDSLPFVRIR
jgi:alpha-tubulin suppressor-like RCC1 family protein